MKMVAGYICHKRAKRANNLKVKQALWSEFIKCKLSISTQNCLMYTHAKASISLTVTLS